MIRSALSLPVVLAAFAVVGVVDVACTPPPAAKPGFCATCDLSNPINAALLPAFRDRHVEPKIAGPRELCARLSIDLLGKPMSAAEAQSMCGSGQSLDDVILAMQGTDDYLVASERHWSDKFQVNDIGGDWRSIKALYDLVDSMHKGEVDYQEFAVQAMASPGLLVDVVELGARARVRTVFRTFMGRKSTDAEEAALSGLFRPWLVRYDYDADFPALYRYVPIVVSGLCEPLSQCSTTMWGGASLAFPDQSDYVGKSLDELDDASKAILRVPGELFTAQPTFYEAAADDLLNRFLDWDEGNRDIRTPGFLFPEVRQAVADTLRSTGDYPAAERLVLTSWLYTQQADVQKDGVTLDGGDSADDPPPFLVGPTKTVPAEVWLAGLQQVTSYDMGGCDNRYADGYPYFLLNQALQDGTITSVDEHNAMIDLLFSERADRGRIAESGGIKYYDYGFITNARMLGGCPGFGTSRQRPAGVSYAILQEGIAQFFCAAGVGDLITPEGDVTPASVAQKIIPLMLSREATDDDVAAIQASMPSGANPADIIAETCVAVAGGAEFLFR